MTDAFKARQLEDRVRWAVGELAVCARQVPLVVPGPTSGHVTAIRAGLVAGLDEIGARP